MTSRMTIVLAAAAICLAVFCGALVYMIVSTVPGDHSSMPMEAAYAWLASGYATLGLLCHYGRLDRAYYLNKLLLG